ncbi:FAD-binding and (Fe-S)-binding domain-containing protein [Micromonospora sp. NPDC005161]
MSSADYPPAPGSRVDRSGVSESDRAALRRHLARALGDPALVAFDDRTRAVYSADSSNYRQVPLGVVYPRDADDVDAVLAACREVGAPVLGRGAATSLAGQTCNVAVLLDFSRHMNRILEIDPDRRLARVQPGVVLDDLRAAAERHGLTFGPDPATHAWCTIGGMVGNNSCGTHALHAGKTVDNTERLVVHTYRGARLDVGPVTDDEYARMVAAGGDAASIHGGLREIARRYGDLVRERYPDIPRRVSGFNLDELLPERGFHVARSLVGTESTCVLVSEITARLIHSPRYRRLVVIGYSDVYAAADAVPGLLGHPLLGLEGFDSTLVRQMRLARLHVGNLDLLPEGQGWLLAEVGADDEAEADALARNLAGDLDPGLDHRIYSEAATQRRIWAIRESGLGATALPVGARPNFEGWEDAAVPPARLGEYLRGIAALWREFGYSGAWYGHFGQGCVHTRNDFDFGTNEGLARYRAYVERAADLCVSLGGSLSGEHGDGQARGELLQRMFGRELVDAFAQFKAVWDPDGKMNPGKVVDPFPLDTNLKHGPDHRVSALRPTWLAFSRTGGSFQEAAERCVGVGRCRNTTTGVMCPSYRATADETHSTRGRARLLSEMFRGEVTREDWRNKDVRAALDLCLSCKGCAVDCPTGVDMASYKAEFLAHHYRGRLRPRAAYALGLIPWAARVATRLPRFANAALRTPLFGGLLRWAAGVTRERPAPPFARRSLRRSLPHRTVADPTVVLWPDTFTDVFEPEVGVMALQALEALGERVAIPTRWGCCGRPLYDSGMLDLAKRTLRQVLDILEPHLDAGRPVVVLEPSCLAVFRDELPEILADDPRAVRLAATARSLSEHVLAADTLPTIEPGSRGRVVVQPHCHGRAIRSTNADAEVLGRLGYEVVMLDAGCCGLAGSFGFRAEHAALSRRIAETGVLAALAGHTDATVVADGFSCATQIRQLGERSTVTTAGLLHTALADQPAATGTSSSAPRPQRRDSRDAPPVR